MAYITITDLQASIDSVNLNAMTADYGDINSSNASTLLTNICQLASDKADSLVSSIYSVPFNPCPPKIRMAAIAFATEMLYQRRLTPTDHNPAKDEGDYWRQILKMINLGQLSLDDSFRRVVPPVTCVKEKNRIDSNIF
jgi:phage gp36-like protein